MGDFIYFMVQSSLLICLVLLITRFGKGFFSARTGYCLWLIPLVRLCLPFFLIPVAVPAAWSSFHPYEMVWNAAEQMTDTVRNAGVVNGSGGLHSAQNGESAGAVLADGVSLNSGSADMDAGRIDQSAGKTASQEDLEEALEAEMGVMAQAGAAAGVGAADSMIASGNGQQNAGVESGASAMSRTGYVLMIALWAAGSLLTGSILLFKNMRFFRWIKTDAKRVKLPADFGTSYRKKEESLHIYYKKELPSPCLAGVLHPAIFVNDRAVKDPEVLRMVLLHERMHYRQRDHIWNFCRNLLCVIYWFHPFVWWGSVASTYDAELSCDERVVESMGKEERRQYGEALLELLNGSCEKKKLLDVTTAMTGGKKEMKERIFTIAKRRKTRKGALALLLTLLLATGILGCTKAQEAGTPEPEGVMETQNAEISEAGAAQTQNAGSEALSADSMVVPDMSGSDGGLTEEFAEEEVQKHEALFSAATSLGADGIILDYMDEEILIFHGYFGLVVYQYAGEGSDFVPGVIDTVDLSAIGCSDTQGESCAEVGVSKNGKNVYMHAMDAADYYRYDRMERKLYRSRAQETENKGMKPYGLAEFLAGEALYELPEDIIEQETFAVNPEKERYGFEMGTVQINGRLTGLTEYLPVWTEKTSAYMKALKERFDRSETGIVDEGWNGIRLYDGPSVVQDLGGAEGRWYKETEYVDENGNRIENPYDCPAWFRNIDGSKKLPVRSFDELICSWGDILFYRYDKAIYVTKNDAIAPYFTISEEDGSIALFTAGKELGAYQNGSDGIGRLTFYDANFNVVKEYENVRLEEFSESYYCLMDLDTGLYGYVDDSGKVVIPFTYSLAKGFHNGYASVLEGAQQEIYYEDRTVKMYDNVGGCWGIIDKKGKYVLEPSEEYSNSFDRDDLGEITEHYVNGPVEFSQVGEDGYVEFVVRETGKALVTGYLVR